VRAKRLDGLRELLEAADVAHARARALERDPVRFARRYSEREDIEVAGVLAAMCAYGRVDLFAPVVARVLAHADARGGPARLAREFSGEDADALADVQYRWNHPADFHVLLRLLGEVQRRHGGVGALFRPGSASESLGGAIAALRALVPPPMSRGVRSWLPSPEDGSACKRWLMLMRWMVRRDEVDLGVWGHLSPRDLVIPLDTHTGRITRFLGLTRRTRADWRAAEEVTARLARLDPDDPVRYDFALAHLGISGGCRGFRDVRVCPACPIQAACRAPRQRS
jgi:uncharacterized protein (TIGR02757 family)